MLMITVTLLLFGVVAGLDDVRCPKELLDPAGTYCGRGGQSCPDGFYCNISPVDAFAECCRGCKYNGKVYAVGESFPSVDGCNTCFCGDDGLVSCTERFCDDGRCPKELLDPAGTYCGRGGQSCPDGYYCNISPVDAFAECCRGCKYNGKVYPVGESFPSVDGCNTCFCGDDGLVSCTKRSCEGCLYNGFSYAFGTVFNDGEDIKCVCLPGGCVECTKGKDFCEYNGLLFSPGQFYDKCNICTCRHGKVTCSKRKCDGLCENGLQPIHDKDCGGIAGIACPKGVCDFSNVPPNVADGTGICCEDLECKDGSSPLGNPLCNSQLQCPTGYECEMVENQKYGVCCQAQGCCKGDATYAVGDPVETKDPCKICSCELDNRYYRIVCAIIDCARPACLEPIIKFGECCPVCEGEPILAP